MKAVHFKERRQFLEPLSPKRTQNHIKKQKTKNPTKKKQKQKQKNQKQNKQKTNKWIHKKCDADKILVFVSEIRVYL